MVQRLRPRDHPRSVSEVTYAIATTIVFAYVVLGAQLYIWHHRDMKPRDIEREPWNRRGGDEWTTAAFRAPILTFMRGYTKGRNWAESWDVTERFTSTNTTHIASGSPSSITVQVPRGPALLLDNIPPDEFKQRPGIRLIVFGVTRIAKAAFGGAKRFEVGVNFPEGIRTTTVELNALLAHVANALDAGYRKDRGLP